MTQGVDRYINALSSQAEQSYAQAVWSYLCGRLEGWPDALSFGLAPIESRSIQKVLEWYAGR
jgi:hypothetical protein